MGRNVAQLVACVFWVLEVAGSNPVIPIQLFTLLVQLVERRFPKPNVVGSNPTGRAYNLIFLTNLQINILKIK